MSNRRNKLKNKFKEIKTKTKLFFNNNNGNICTLLGLIIINISVYLFNFKIGLLITGLCFIALGYLINSNK